MPITDYLERNADMYGDEVALVELNPEQQEIGRITWKEYELIQPTKTQAYRRQITWKVLHMLLLMVSLGSLKHSAILYSQYSTSYGSQLSGSTLLTVSGALCRQWVGVVRLGFSVGRLSDVFMLPS